MTGPGLYVHIPFCSIKCYYCDFTAFAGQGRQTRRYLEALEAEAAMFAPQVPETLYIGGGTPSELSAVEIRDLLALIRRSYPEAVFKEATFEANPESLDLEKLERLADGGVDRLSLGLQTADDGLLKSVGRRHDFSDFKRVYAAARAMDSFDLSVDLMYGLPDQTIPGFLASLDAVLGLEPEHLSVYGLHVEDRTLFAKRGVEPSEDLARGMFEACLDRLSAAGYNHYEISNFAKPGFESKHNSNYWANGEYIGLGCGASSFLDGVRSSNDDRLLPYMDRIRDGFRPTVNSERLDGKEKIGEKTMLGLRLLKGMPLDSSEQEVFAAQWKSLLLRGLVTRDDSRARLTRQGVFYYNQAAAEFVAPFGPIEATS